MIRFVRGNLFESQAEALVNTVNCVGVMGKGIAHQFQRAYPAMFADYSRRCRAGTVRLGEVTTFPERGKLIVNFPTKNHWKARSRIEDIGAGLRALAALITDAHVRSIAIPPLGCGNGGLDWNDVRPVIERELGALADVEITVFEPVGTFKSAVAKEPRVSLGHFVLAALATHIRKKLALQKASYFFNVFAGEPYFKFTQAKFGPYFVGMDPMLQELADYRDFTKLAREQIVEDGIQRKLAGADVDRLRNWLPVIDRTVDFVQRHSNDIEALATAHAVISQSPSSSDEQVVTRFLAWSTEKAERFERADVLAALRTLEEEHLVVRSLYGYQVGTPPPRTTVPASTDS